MTMASDALILRMSTDGGKVHRNISSFFLDVPGDSFQNNNQTMDNAADDPLISLTIPAIMFTSGVIGNILAIVVLLFSSKEHKQTVFYRLVGALAITDLFGTCATSPVTIAVYANNLKWVGGDALCNYESFVLIFAGNSTIFIVGTMAIDRFIALKKPFFYQYHATYSRAKYIILGIWGVAGFIGLLPVMGLGKNVKQYPGTWCFFSFTSSDVANQVYSYMWATIGLMFIGMTALTNVVVTVTLLKMRRRAMSLTGNQTTCYDSDLQMVILLLGIIVIFSTCWSPFLIRILINQSHECQLNVKADLHALKLASFNQILDPWVYILFRRELFARIYRFTRKLLSSSKKCSCAIASIGRDDPQRDNNNSTSDNVDICRTIQKYHNGFETFDNGSRVDTINGQHGTPGSVALLIDHANGYAAKHNVSNQHAILNSMEHTDKCTHLTTGTNQCLSHSACLFCLSLELPAKG